ncbi:MAG TPA: type II toxin-antitoxin system VapC family toxin [Thermoanaerobaculia bacterium]|nr:type II toxin-antitoxin system VapC family toxin [Thermoanaerobaculia bacterium]
MIARSVLDASAAVHLVLRGVHASKLSQKLKDVAVVMTPELYCSEVANSLLKYVRAGQLTVDQAISRFERCMALAGTLIPEATLASEALVAASRTQGSVYDMMYAVLARRSGATVITMDRPFALRLRDMDIEAYCPLTEA